MKLIVCEMTGDWAALLRPHLPKDVALVAVRSLMEMSDRVDESPSAVVATEWTTGQAEVFLAEIAHINRKHPQARVIVLSHRKPSCDEPACREAGAIHVVTSRRRLGEVIAIIQHLRQTGDRPEDPDIEQDLEAAMMARLPWRQ